MRNAECGVRPPTPTSYAKATEVRRLRWTSLLSPPPVGTEAMENSPF